MVTGLIIVAVVLLLAIAELRHHRAVYAARWLLLDLPGRRRRLVLASIGRVTAVAMLATGGLLLQSLGLSPDAGTASSGSADPAAYRRVVIALDASPSMQLVDASAPGQTRATLATKTLRKMLESSGFGSSRVSVVAFYTDAKPVVIDTTDPNVVLNVLDGLPLSQAFQDGPTDLAAGVKGVFELIKPWPPDTVDVLVFSDGDSNSNSDFAAIPPALHRVTVIGVGDSRGGTFIDDHMSRQDVSALRALATRLQGRYFNAESGLTPPDMFEAVGGTIPNHRTSDQVARLLAQLAIVAAVLVLLLTEPVLNWLDARSVRHPQAEGRP